MPKPHEISLGPPHGSITAVEEDGITVLVLDGEIDTDVVAAFAREPSTEAAPITVIDVGDVTLLSVTAVRLLLDIRWTAVIAGWPLVLRRSNAHVDRVLRLLGLADAFPRPCPEHG